MNNNTHTNDLGHSPDALAQRRAELLALLRQAAPELMTDNQLDVVRLKDLLGVDLTATDEHYELNWAGKAAARREIQKTTSHTLLPDASNPAQAAHMLIEGENLEVLRLLQKSYYGKVKMIYIDPPYNTGNDSFVYPDNYSETLDEYQRRTGEKNEAGFLNKQSLWKKNGKESGQYHSAWLSMMYPRLYLARNLLRDDGVIFISIDDNEAANLKLLCDEVFGAENFVANVLWQKKYSVSNDDPGIAPMHDHIYVYRKSIAFVRNLLPRSDKQMLRYKNIDNDPRGDWASGEYVSSKTKNERPTLWYPIKHPKNGEAVWPDQSAVWRYSKEQHEIIESEDRLYWGPENSYEKPRLKRFLSEMQDGVVPSTWWTFDEVGHNDEGQKETAELIGRKIFSTPKPVRLLNRILKLATDGNSLVLDFFAGSGSISQAVMELNLEDGGNRQSISVQMPEILDEDSEAYKAGYRTIADITRARISKVIAKLKAEQPDKTTALACAHFTLAPSNFKVWRSQVADTDALREQLALFQTAEKMDSRVRRNDKGEGNDSGEVDDGAVGNDSRDGNESGNSSAQGQGSVQGQGSAGVPATQASHAHTAMLAELLLKHGLGALGVTAISSPQIRAGVTVHLVRLPNDNNADKTLWLCFDPYNPALKDEIVQAKPAQVVMLNSCFVGPKADELLSNLQLELAANQIGLTVI